MLILVLLLQKREQQQSNYQLKTQHFNVLLLMSVAVYYTENCAYSKEKMRH